MLCPRFNFYLLHCTLDESLILKIWTVNQEWQDTEGKPSTSKKPKDSKSKNLKKQIKNFQKSRNSLRDLKEDVTSMKQEVMIKQKQNTRKSSWKSKTLEPHKRKNEKKVKKKVRKTNCNLIKGRKVRTRKKTRWEVHLVHQTSSSKKWSKDVRNRRKLYKTKTEHF